MTKILNFVWPIRMTGDPDLFRASTDPKIAEINELPVITFNEAGLEFTNVISERAYCHAAILYPSTMAPAISTDDNHYIELVIAAEKPLEVKHIEHCLFIGEGLGAEKRYADIPLTAFAYLSGIEPPNPLIEVDLINTLSKGSEEDAMTYVGSTGLQATINPKARDALLEEFYGLPELCWVHIVRIHSCIVANAAKLFAQDESLEYSDRPLFKKATFDVDLNLDGNPAPSHRFGLEASDWMIDKLLERDKNVVERPLSRDRLPRGGHSLDYNCPNWSKPVLSYHPVFYYPTGEEIERANIGFVSDIHINSRLEVLKYSDASIIEDGQCRPDKDSPKIGDRLRGTNASFIDIIDRLGRSEADILIVGGDLIDHIINVFPDPTLEGDPSVTDIWDMVSLPDKPGKRYLPGIDYIVFYSLLVDFMAEHHKPVFVISGNHDCYAKPYGISPQALGKRFNEGIPADINLTIYEALLAFGPSYGKVSKSFKSAWFDWYYTLISPFTNLCVPIGKQVLTLLGWGDDEDMVTDLNKWKDRQGLGHLPRAVESVSETQLAMLNNAIAGGEVVLITHFTVLSYIEAVPLYGADESQSPGTLRPGVYNKFGMGTFEKGREELIALIDTGQIRCVISGHSHRRGLYYLDEPASKKSNSSTLRCRVYEIGDDEVFAGNTRTAIFVADSAGPYPRFNGIGEFGGWGSDRPAGLLVSFDEDQGYVQSTQVVAVNKSGASPRAIVALDYYDIFESVFEGQIQTQWFALSQMYAPDPLEFRFQLVEHLQSELGIEISAITLIGETAAGGLSHIVLSRSLGSDPTWQVDNRRAFYAWEGCTAKFMSVKFSVKANVLEGESALRAARRQRFLIERYNWHDRWLVEVSSSNNVLTSSAPDYIGSGGYDGPTAVKIVIKRTKRGFGDVALPDFDARRIKYERVRTNDGST